MKNFSLEMIKRRKTVKKRETFRQNAIISCEKEIVDRESKLKKLEDIELPNLSEIAVARFYEQWFGSYENGLAEVGSAEQWRETFGEDAQEFLDVIFRDSLNWDIGVYKRKIENIRESRRPEEEYRKSARQGKKLY
jgi:hypothetical protein